MTRPTLIFVHGRAQQGRDPNAIKLEWIDTLRLGLGPKRSAILDDLDVRLPFYGDVLDGYAQQMDEAIPADILVRGDSASLDQKYMEFRAEMLTEMCVGAGVTTEQAQIFMDKTALERGGPLNWKWVQALMRAADALPGVSAASIERFTRDVFLYLSRTKIRNEVNGLIEAALPASPAVVVAHSLGSVVAYDVLRKVKRSVEIPLLVTVGSPLGVGPIQRTLHPLGFPQGINSWFNAMDERDVVALLPLTEPQFSVIPPVENFTGVTNRTENAHGISGYLNDESVAQRIYAALTA